MRRIAACALAFLAGATPASASVIGWGHNFGGELGLGYNSPRNVLSPAPVQLPPGVKQLAGGSAWAAALLSDGTVKVWGSNWAGALGLGNPLPTNVPRPTTIPGLTHVTEIAAAGLHGMALLENGTVETWGSDLFGQLGTGVSAHGKEALVRPMPTPRLVPGLSGVQSIYAGGANDAAILKDGTVRAWGEGPALCPGHRLYEAPVPVAVPIAHVRSLALGGEATLGGHVLFLMQDGSVQACGDNQYGQAGIGRLTETLRAPLPVPGLSGITQLAAGPWHSLALRSDGTVFAWGADNERQVGTAATMTCGRGRRWPCVPHPTAVVQGASQVAAGYPSYAVAGGRVLGWGSNRRNELGTLANPQPVPAPIPGIENVTGLQVGLSFAFAELAGPASAALQAPAAELVSNAPGTLTVVWRSPPQAAIWKVQVRPVTKPKSKWGPFNTLPPTARSFTFTGLASGREYQVLLTNMASGVRGLSGVAR
jgi:alpha-tubulin suppressor-like RCC1 family protein